MTQEQFTVEGKLQITNQLLAQLIRTMNDIKVVLKEINRENPVSFTAQRRIVPTAGTAIQLDDMLLSKGMSVAIKALVGNTGTIYIGSSKVNAQDTKHAFPLGAGSAIELKVRNLNSIWVDTSVDGEGINWVVELDPKVE